MIDVGISFVGASTRQVSGRSQAAESSQRSSELVSVSQQQSRETVSTRSSASTTAVYPSAVRSSSQASTIRPNTSQNNNVNAAPGSLSTSVAGQHHPGVLSAAASTSAVCQSAVRGYASTIQRNTNFNAAPQSLSGYLQRDCQKIPLRFSDNFSQTIENFSPNFTHLLLLPIYAGLQICIQLLAILTKLCHIKRDHPVHTVCSKCPPLAETCAGIF